MALDQQKLLSFSLGNEEYGVSIMKVKELIGMMDITPVPKTPDFIKGVINLRGEVLPVMSLRVKFGLEDDEITNLTRIIIIKLEPQAAVGILVDMVKEVITISDDEIEPVAQNSTDEKAMYLSGIGKYGNELISLLNIAGVVIDKDMDR